MQISVWSGLERWELLVGSFYGKQRIYNLAEKDTCQNHEETEDYTGIPAKPLAFLPDTVVFHAPYCAKTEESVPGSFRHCIAKQHHQNTESNCCQLIHVCRLSSRVVVVHICPQIDQIRPQIDQICDYKHELYIV